MRWCLINRAAKHLFEQAGVMDVVAYDRWTYQLVSPAEPSLTIDLDLTHIANMAPTKTEGRGVARDSALAFLPAQSGQSDGGDARAAQRW
jgi:hypothetical protein